ncbi:hypothetical protein [Bartonella tribocorum]|uniref:Uncharacterized protein n=1 Tax=Bartonella tribocorum (strain DSM 28219 / CCUG 45778 / CIP 105476 / IBS 506) TaxID=382640 RepID=A9IVY0_BART1|nr:hypothetical protein [Bartonella tribocorum]CAK01829.1 hypothetical protein predicted by Glimmer/Critica [Bartonella tribocorum CIP 105476]CDO49078.1 hypothetical protein BM1374166_01406 [Bartonella tribocorum]
MGCSSSSPDSGNSCRSAGYWDAMKTAGQTGAAIMAPVGAVGGAILGRLAGVAARQLQQGGAAAPTILKAAEAGMALGTLGGTVNGAVMGGAFGAVPHLYNCVR